MSDIFRGHHHGGFCHDYNDSILENRKFFKDEFDLLERRCSFYGKTPFGLRNRFKKEINPEWPGNFTFDHFELYERRGKKGFVSIFSPYGGLLECNTYYQEAIDLGYKQYHSNLYSTDGDDIICPTYYKLIPFKK